MAHRVPSRECGTAAPERHLMAFDWSGRLAARAKLAAKATSDRTPWSSHVTKPLTKEGKNLLKCTLHFYRFVII